MSLYDFANRIKRMRDRESALVQKEAMLAKNSAKYYAAMGKLREQLRQQQKELKISKRRTAKLSLQHAKLDSVFEKQKHYLHDIKLRIEDKKDALQKLLMEQEQKRQLALQEMKRLCALKEVTKTFINLNALPSMVQGVTLCEKENAEWLPFSVELKGHTQEHVQNYIWANAGNSGPLRQEWENLLFDKNMQTQQ